LLVGPVGLLGLKRRRDPQRHDRAQAGLDTTFLIMLFLTSLTGFLLLVLRESVAMGVTLAVHLGVVMGLFLAMPYGKFVHGIYRFAALVQNAAEAEHGVMRQ
jgi:citrate/tricarballylate utilization protein